MTLSPQAPGQRNALLRCLAPAPLPEITKGAFLLKKKWLYSELYVGFMEGGNATLRERILAIAQTWGQHCGLKFLPRNDVAKASVRVSITNFPAFWSYIGRDAENVASSQPTVSLGANYPGLADADLEGFVLHEFGHVLGMVHEHQSPNARIEWNEDAVFADLEGPPAKWTEDYIRQNVLQRYAPGATMATDFDPQSIMIYPIPEAWTLPDEQGRHFSVPVQRSLSAMDKQLVGQAYP